MQRYIFPATYTIVNVVFLVTFNYFNAFSLGKGHFFAPSRLYNGPAYAQNRPAFSFNKKHQKGYCLQSSPFTICVKSDQFSTLKARISRTEALNHAIFFNA